MTPASALVLGLLAGSALAAAPTSPRAELKDAIEKLKAAPDDAELRKRIIALAAKTKAAVPEEAREHFVMGTTMQKTAKSAGDAAQAIDEYKQALLIAPWWRDAYYNLSLAAETAERFDDAEAALDLYLATKPGAADERRAKDRLYALRAKKKMKAGQDAAAASARASRAAAERDKFAASIEGHWGYLNDTLSFDVTRSGGGVEIVCRWYNSASGWNRPTAEGVELSGTGLHFKCTDGDGFSRVFDMTMDDQGRLRSKTATLSNGESVTFHGRPLVEDQIFTH